jgi:hypothetical protein
MKTALINNSKELMGLGRRCMTLNNHLKLALIVGSIVGLVMIVVIYVAYQQILRNESARLEQVRQQGILYDKHKQQCRDVASDLSLRIQELTRQEKDRSLSDDF